VVEGDCSDWTARVGKEMMLYVWKDFSPDYTPGLAFAIAEDIDHAMALVIEFVGYDPSDWGVCEEYAITNPIGFGQVGGS